MKIVYAFLSLAFTAFAVVQYNDPDPYVWLMIYGYLALVFGFAAAGRERSLPLWPAFLLTILAMAWSFHGLQDFIHNQQGYNITDIMSDDLPWIEETREFGGGLIGFFATCFMWWRRKVN